ncbi:hypothetical protein AYO47_05605 [Planctomyces sp. SCGC AG-212-M04]|nr:hypothetical protein AYO47_05605 [Planctomyces sp. SCGC AG-212-M04]
MFEPVYTVLDFYDHERKGIAKYQGLPHLFQSEWRDFQTGPDAEYLDDDTFLLMPIDPSLFCLTPEDGARLEIDPTRSVRKGAEFRRGTDHPLEVRWFDIE